MANGFTVRRATDADRSHIKAAVALLLPGVDIERRHRWLYDDNPHGRALTWVAVDDATGEVAGVTSLFPRRVVVEGRDVMAALGGDGYVHEKFRRRGIATAMHGVSRDMMRRLEMEVMFGTPLPPNTTPLAQHDTRDVVDIVRYARPLGGRAFGLPGVLDALLRRVLRPSHDGLEVDTFRERDPRVDEIWARTRKEFAIAAVRDAAFYDWRFRRSFVPSELPYVVVDHGRAIAACALEREGNRLRILDLLAPRADWPRALAAIIAFAGECDVVDLKLARTDADTRGLWRWGFIPRGGKPLNIMVPMASARRDVYFDDSKWFFTCV